MNGIHTRSIDGLVRLDEDGVSLVNVLELLGLVKVDGGSALCCQCVRAVA